MHIFAQTTFAMAETTPFGIDLELLCFAISAAWYWQDYGVVYGLAPRDVLSIEIALLID